jgi:hypothetical protein
MYSERGSDDHSRFGKLKRKAERERLEGAKKAKSTFSKLKSKRKKK